MKKMLIVLAIVLAIAPAALARTASSNTIHLVVNNGASFSTQPADTAGYVGDNATLTVAATGGTGPYTYKWYKGVTLVAGATSASYTITGLVLGDAGSYTCVVTTLNGAGVSTTSNAATISVYSLPTVSIVSVPAATAGTVTVNPGVAGGVVYTATPSGGWGASPAWTFVWQRSADGATGWTAVSGAAFTVSDASGYTGNVLTVNPVSTGEADYYRCVVDDNSGH